MTHQFPRSRPPRAWLKSLLLLVLLSCAGLACRPSTYDPGPQRDSGPGVSDVPGGPDSADAPSIGRDVGPDAGPDVPAVPNPDGKQDVSSDAPMDAAPDLPADVGPDAMPDAAPDMGRDAAPSCVSTPLPQAKFPFPQNRWGTNCIKPSAYSNDDVQRAYCQWKNDTVTTEGVGSCSKGGCYRVKRPNEPGSLERNSTVSEGIAYGMLIAVYMNDQKLFDGLWKYEQQYLDDRGLMHWYIKADGSGTGPGGNGAATDADEDMAFALVMADRQWGGQGSLDKTYLKNAQEQIGKVWSNEVVDSKAIKAGDAWGGWDNLNISYFAPSYYRVFADVDPSHAWKDVITTSYDIIDHALSSANGNQSNGLVPAWVSCNTTSCSPTNNAWADKPGQSPTNYQYDSCRTPFRIGLDWCWYGSTRARDYVAKTSSFFAGIGASKIVDGYACNGTAQPATAGKSAAFIGPAAVGAMSAATYQTFVDEAYAEVATLKALTGGTYYEDSWMVLSLLALTGNFIDFTAY